MHKKVISLIIATLMLSSTSLMNTECVVASPPQIATLKPKPKKIKIKKKKKHEDKVLTKLKKIYGNKVKGYTKINCTLSYYTSLPQENGGYNCTANGKKFKQGYVANNRLPFNTKLYFEGMGTYSVQDRGYSGFNNYHRYDVFVPRLRSESDRAYLRRVNNMGKKKVVGYIIKF